MRFFRNRILIKTVVCFLVFEILLSAIAPSLSWALTAGPSAPEFSSFEPVDTTDLVNLSSGDFVYNTPILEVPGPAGGYPLSLSYHAGIKNDQEASWVGLGWTLNPGSITRSVNGFMDDGEKIRTEVRDYWDGGETTTKTYSLGVSIPNTGIGINHTLAVTSDTYRGMSHKLYHNVSVNYGAMANGVASGSFGRASQSGLKSNPVTLNSPGIGLPPTLSQDFSISSTGVKASTSVFGYSFKPNNNSKGAINKYSTDKDYGTISANIYGFNVSFGMKSFYTRYWSSQADAHYGFGALYSLSKARHTENSTVIDSYYGHNGEPDLDSDILDGDAEFRSFSDDIYSIAEGFNPGSSLITTHDQSDQADPSRQFGGSLPATDYFAVSSQGIGGIIEPVCFTPKDVFGQNKYIRGGFYGGPATTHPTVKYEDVINGSQLSRAEFRFKGDFSNGLTMDPGRYYYEQGILKNSEPTISSSAEGYHAEMPNKLPGSKNIEWFTTQEIIDGSAKAKGFIDYYEGGQRKTSYEIYDDYLQPEACLLVNAYNVRGKQRGMYRTDRYHEEDFEELPVTRHNSLKPNIISLNSRIGGFMITNSSGVTYHYGIPVYAYNEYTRQKQKKPLKDATTITEYFNNEPYAYTWLLTAITGPDFVDRGGSNGLPNGVLDDSDFGYWVKFDYGMWTDSYQWRTPHTGFSTDMESEYWTFSYGIKELYYLDAIETKTHKAFFVKSKRKDGRGVTSRLEGGSNPRKYTMPVGPYGGRISFSVSPVSTLKLDAIYLFDKKDIINNPISKAGGDIYDNAPISDPYMYPYVGDDYEYQFFQSGDVAKIITIKQGEDSIKVKYHNGDLVYDFEDFQDLAELKNKALKSIVFETDYSLAKGVSNSIGFYSDSVDYNTTCATQLENGCSRENFLLTPNFDFEWPEVKEDDCFTPPYLTRTPPCCISNESSNAYSGIFYSKEPLLMFDTYLCKVWDGSNRISVDNSTYENYLGSLGVTYNKTGKLTLNKVKILGKAQASLLPPLVFTYNKNPDYNYSRYDDWGYYKSDWRGVQVETAEMKEDGDGYYWDKSLTWEFGTRKVTESSASNIDAWSLSEIKTPTGAKIKVNYEANSFSKSVYNNFNQFSIESIEQVPNSQYVNIYFKEKDIQIGKYFDTDKEFDIKIYFESNRDSEPYSEWYQNNTQRIVSYGSDWIRVNSLDLYNLLGRVRSINGVSSKTYFIAGFIILPPDTNQVEYGGGIRTKSIELIDISGNSNKTEFHFNKPQTQISSGVTSFKPFTALNVSFPNNIYFFRNIMERKFTNEKQKKLLVHRSNFMHAYNYYFEDFMKYMREAPAPGIIYEFVSVKNFYNNVESDSYVQYHNKVFNKDLVSLNIYADQFLDENGQIVTYEDNRSAEFVNNANDVGSLLDVSTYSKNGTILKKTINGYLYDEVEEPFESTIKQSKQGVMEQAFSRSLKTVDYQYIDFPIGDGGYYNVTDVGFKNVLIKKIDKTNIITTVKSIDYKTGLSTTQEFRAFDYFSGEPIQIFNQDADGSKFVKLIKPAYRVAEYSGVNDGQTFVGMGIKLRNPQNKHMLSQVAEEKVYKIDNANNLVGLVSYDVQTWTDRIPVLNMSTQTGIWRKQSKYQFIGNDLINEDGLFPMENGQLPSFAAWGEDQTESTGLWQKGNEITLYDIYSHPLEANDLNEQYGATKMSRDETVVLATVANARYSEFAFSGAENLNLNGDLGGGVMTQGELNYEGAHTGNYEIITDPGEKGFSFTATVHDNAKFFASVWTTRADALIKYRIGTGNVQTAVMEPVRRTGGWIQLNGMIPELTAGSVVEIWCEANTVAHFDDFRVHPYDAVMTSYVYNNWGELAYILDSDNKFTFYEYDGMGRLVKTTRETFSYDVVKTGEIKYNYSNR